MRRPLAVILALTIPPILCAAEPSFSGDFERLHTDLGPVPFFSLTERSGRTVTRDDLRGKVWIAAFVFTGCAGDCGKVTETMARLQRDLAGYPDVVLVSFSVDPANDTPAVLTKYADGWGAHPERWLFLTGGAKEMDELIQKGFVQSVVRKPDADPGYEVDHTFRLVVVDHRGRIRGYIDDGRSDAEIPALERRVKRLVQAKYLPSVNASLNGASAVLLVLGYLAIRGRWITLHKACMLSALAVSAVFLGCYLYYHFVVLRGQPTRFPAEGTARGVYLAVLWSHIVLAAVVAPLALFTAYQGLRGRLAQHVKVARWTLPLWLYVGVTGVVVYWMLYHLYPGP